ncbi:MAG: helix-hairpin-helix domain-containing protein [Bryobacterales bacterium]
MKLWAAAVFVFAASLAAEDAPRVDVNTARVADLEALPGIGRITAERILRMRERNGPFRCVEELRAVPRVTEAQFQALSAAVFVADPDPRCKQAEAARRRGERID